MTTLSLSLMQSGVVARETSDDDELVRRFLERREPDAFAMLIRPYEARVHRLVAATLGPRLQLEVEDCVQDILIHVFHKLPAFRFESRFSTWLYTVARNKALDLHRRPRHKRPHLDDTFLAREEAREEGPYESATRNEAARQLRAEVEALGEPERSAVHLFYWMDASIEDVAELLRLKPATVKSHLFRARKRLLNRIGGGP